MIHRDVERVCRRGMSEHLHRACVVGAGLLYIVSYFVLEGQMPVLYYGGLFVHSILCGILLLLLPYSGMEKILERGPLTIVGKMSYELYLWMYPIIFLFGYNKKNYGILSWCVQLALIGVIAGIQYAVTRYMHQNRQHQGGNIMGRLAYVAGSLGIAFMVLVGSVVVSEKLPEGGHNSAKVLAKETSVSAKKPMSAKDMESKISESTGTQAPVAMTTESVTEAPMTQKTVTAIGDSVLLGADSDIEDTIPNCVVDAKESRQVAKARTVVEDLKQKGELGDVVILALGTNGTFSPTVGKNLVEAIGKERQIYWVTAYGKHLQWQEDANRMIWSMAEKYDNIHVIDWAAYCAGHDDWFLNDGIHLTQKGCQAYTQMLYDNVSTALTENSQGKQAMQ